MGDTWDCGKTGKVMAAYGAGTLSLEETEKLEEHLWRCPRCHKEYWVPFFEADAVIGKQLLDELTEEWEGAPALHVPTWDQEATRADLEPIGAAASPAGAGGRGKGGVARGAMPAPGLERVDGPRLRVLGLVLPLDGLPSALERYTVYLGPRGAGFASFGDESAILEVSIGARPPGIVLRSLAPDVVVDGTLLSVGADVSLARLHQIACPGSTFILEVGREGGASWQGAGVLYFGGATYPIEGDVVTIGRGERCSIRLSDERVRNGLGWNRDRLSELNQDRRKKMEQFTLDSVHVSREHARLERRGEEIWIRGLKRYPVVRIREGVTEESRAGAKPLMLRAWDRVVVGHCLFAFERSRGPGSEG